jgi:hypothetical protein
MLFSNMNVRNHKNKPIDFGFAEFASKLARFFAPLGAGVNEEPERSGARRSQNQFTPLGVGVDKLIFKRFRSI